MVWGWLETTTVKLKTSIETRSFVDQAKVPSEPAKRPRTPQASWLGVQITSSSCVPYLLLTGPIIFPILHYYDGYHRYYTMETMTVIMTITMVVVIVLVLIMI